MPSAVVERWHRSPVLWLGAALLGASLLGCIATIVLALRHADPELALGAEALLDVPAAHAGREP